MTVAFSDAVLLTDYLRPSKVDGDGGLVDLHDWEEVRERLQQWYWTRKNVASVVNILSIALYDLFGADGKCLINWVTRPCVLTDQCTLIEKMTIWQCSGTVVSSTLNSVEIA